MANYQQIRGGGAIPKDRVVSQLHYWITHKERCKDITKLSAMKRAVFVCMLVNTFGFNYSEAGRALEISHSTAKRDYDFMVMWLGSFDNVAKRYRDCADFILYYK